MAPLQVLIRWKFSLIINWSVKTLSHEYMSVVRSRLWALACKLLMTQKFQKTNKNKTKQTNKQTKKQNKGPLPWMRYFVQLDRRIICFNLSQYHLFAHFNLRTKLKVTVLGAHSYSEEFTRSSLWSSGYVYIRTSQTVYTIINNTTGKYCSVAFI